VEYTILKHKWDLLAREVLGEEFVRKSHYHNRNVTWVPMGKEWYSLANHGQDRYVGSITNYWANRCASGFDIQNI
jgi:hypothetical protein